MSNEIEFFTNPTSRGRVVRWMLEELETPYKTVLLSFGEEMKRPDYLAINPMGKVPALRHRGQIITEVPAILAYLADQFPDKELAPSVSDPLRGAYYRWLFFGAGPMEYAVVNRSFGFEVPEEGRGRMGYGSFETVMRVLKDSLKDVEYITGKFSAADIYIASHLGWGMLMGGLEKKPVFEAYVGRLLKRPAAIRARELDDALAPRRT